MNRRAIIIGSPDDDIPGPKRDLVNYQSFLLSPLGGAWESSEVLALESPSWERVARELQSLRSVDYSLVIFSGHGSHTSANTPPRIWLRSDTEIDSIELRVGAPKRTLVLDCCRVHQPEVVMDSALAKAQISQRRLNTTQCRYFFDAALRDCEKGMVILYSCSFDEAAGNSGARGGWYSSALLDAARSWDQRTPVNTESEYAILSVLQAHDMAIPEVRRLSDNEQNPDREQPRGSKKYYPFAIIA